MFHDPRRELELLRDERVDAGRIVGTDHAPRLGPEDTRTRVLGGESPAVVLRLGPRLVGFRGQPPRRVRRERGEERVDRRRLRRCQLGLDVGGGGGLGVGALEERGVLLPGVVVVVELRVASAAAAAQAQRDAQVVDVPHELHAVRLRLEPDVDLQERDYSFIFP